MKRNVIIVEKGGGEFSLDGGLTWKSAGGQGLMFEKQMVLHSDGQLYHIRTQTGALIQFHPSGKRKILLISAGASGLQMLGHSHSMNF